MNRSIRLLLVAAVAAAVGCLVWNYWPTEEKRVRKAIVGMAADATFTGKEGNFAKLAKIESLAGRFTEDADIRVDQVVPIDPGLHGRESIRQVLGAGLPFLGSVRVQVHDLRVEMIDDTSAKAVLTASAQAGGQKDLSAQEFELRMVKQKGRWLVGRVEAILGYRKPVIQ
jgi:hypothetical protein